MFLFFGTDNTDFQMRKVSFKKKNKLFLGEVSVVIG